MDRILRIEEGEVKLIDPVLELMPEIATLYSLKYNKQVGDLDGRKRFRVKKEFTYIWFMYNAQSPYREYDEAERKEESLRTAGLPLEYEFSTEFLLFQKKYLKCNKSRLLKLIEAAEVGIDKLREYFETINFTDTTATGALVNKPTDFIATVAKLDQLAEGLKSLENRQKTEKNQFISARGEQEAGYLMERDDFKTTNNGDLGDTDT